MAVQVTDAAPLSEEEWTDHLNGALASYCQASVTRDLVVEADATAAAAEHKAALRADRKAHQSVERELRGLLGRAVSMLRSGESLCDCDGCKRLVEALAPPAGRES